MSTPTLNKHIYGELSLLNAITVLVSLNDNNFTDKKNFVDNFSDRCLYSEIYNGFSQFKYFDMYRYVMIFLIEFISRIENLTILTNTTCT